MDNNRRKYLTEKMGECWHDWKCAEFKTLKCSKCGKWIYEKDTTINSNRRTFTTWGDFGAVWEWARLQEWWPKFCRKYMDECLCKGVGG